MQADLLVRNIGDLATPIANGPYAPATFLRIRDAAIAAHSGKIVYVGKGTETDEVTLSAETTVIDANGATVTPGFVDCHTHPIFFGTREGEFEMRIQGKSYEEIAGAGGGILSSVRSLRSASKEELIQAALPRLDRFLSLGTTTIEAKSGYGLTVADEIKSLQVIQELNRLHPLDLIPTFLGAHEVPQEFRDDRERYLDLVVNEMIPQVAEEKLAEFCDVFCESHVFTVQESRRVLQTAAESGLELKIHAEQLTHNGGAALAADIGAKSADHLEHTTEEDWAALLDRRVVPVLLPGAVFFLGKDRYAPGRKMLDSGLPVAIATDFNPGTCMSESMPMMLTIACLKLRLDAAEALTAATYHAALAVNKGNLFGSLEVGKEADLVVWDTPNFKHLSYHFGVNLAQTVIKSGKVVYEN